MPAVCGRVCPQEDQCEARCVLNKKKVPINIGALERYAADFSVIGDRLAVSGEHRTPNTENPDKVAVVGSGPAGLTCAADLARLGYQVTLFESLHVAGGVLRYGIPEFRLPKEIVRREIAYITGLGVDLQVDVLVGNTITIDTLFKEGYKAVFIATGAGLPQFLGIPGENCGRVYSANEFLTRINLMKAYQFGKFATPVSIGEKVAVVGGGNVAFDCARVARRMGKTVTLVYRRTERQMPARLEEIHHAKEEGVAFKELTQPVEILSDDKGFVKGLVCVAMELGEPDATGRSKPVPVENSRFVLDVDTVIIAIGQNPNPLLPKTVEKLATHKDGTIVVDSALMTSLPGVFAGGDIASGADTVIQAMGAGKKAAQSIVRFLRENKS